MSSSVSLHLTFWGRVSLLNLELTNLADWLASEFQLSICPYLPSTRITGTCHCAILLCFIFVLHECQIQDFMLAQVLYWLAISPVLDFFLSARGRWIWNLVYTKYTFYHWATLQPATPFYEWIWQHLSHGTTCLCIYPFSQLRFLLGTLWRAPTTPLTPYTSFVCF